MWPKFGQIRYCPARWIWLKGSSFDRSSLESEAGSFSEKSVRPPIRWEKLQRHLVRLLAIRKWIPNVGSEIHRAIGMGGICVRFFKGWTDFPHSLWRAASVFAQVPTSLEASSRSVHSAVANIAEGSLRRSQYCGGFIMPLPISRRVHCTLANILKGS